MMTLTKLSLTTLLPATGPTGVDVDDGARPGARCPTASRCAAGFPSRPRLAAGPVDRGHRSHLERLDDLLAEAFQP
jgi:hypothetical protein